MQHVARDGRTPFDLCAYVGHSGIAATDAKRWLFQHSLAGAIGDEKRQARLLRDAVGYRTGEPDHIALLAFLFSMHLDMKLSSSPINTHDDNRTIGVTATSCLQQSLHHHYHRHSATGIVLPPEQSKEVAIVVEKHH